MTNDEMDVIIARSMAAAHDNGYEEEMRTWTTYEHAIDLGDTEPDLEGVDVFDIEAGVKRFLGPDFQPDEADGPSGDV